VKLIAKVIACLAAWLLQSGAGATLRPLKGRAHGIGPALSCSFPAGTVPASLSIWHFQEFGVENRFNGKLTTATATVKF
jgi:hypothetical protein